MAEKKIVEGLGGWLMLVGIGLIIAPFKVILGSYPLFSEMLFSENYELMTTSGSEYYTPGFSLLIYFEIVLNIFIFAVWVYVAYLFFLKKKLFPKWYIGILLFTIVFVILDSVAVNLVFSDIAILDADTEKELFRSGLMAAIWIPYILLSKQVKATFVR